MYLYKNLYICIGLRNKYTGMKNKKQRLLTIREIILNQKIGSQDELLSLLMEKCHDLTQATFSRDLKQLQIAKVADNKVSYVYILPDMGGIGKIVQSKNTTSY